MRFKITSKQSEERIDKFLADNLPDFSRSQIQKLIREKCITVNKKNTNAHYNLKEGDEIEIRKTINKRQKAKLSPNSKFPIPNSQFQIISDTPEYIIINKPAGLTMHGADHIKEITLADLVLKKYPKIKKVGEDPARPGIVHRIDKEVSGLIVVPKTQDSFDNLKKQFQERTVKKQYTALVYGKIKKEEDIINFPIKRAESGHKMAALPLSVKGKSNIGGRRAITEFEVIKKYINYTLIKVNIKTGRTHQIRVHMTAYGHPIVGDNLYSTKKTREQNKKLKLERVFLFANKLSFTDLPGKKQTFKINMPSELKEILEKIK
jgi:23S rRNA pseudouridine1911/1915/1917 synthase